MLKAEGPGLDAVSYHYYGAFSKRCLSMGAQFLTSPEDALTPQWLSATADDADFYGSLRDRFEPGKALWLSETAQAACGGDPWAATFVDSFRYLNQLGLLAKHGVSVTMHNTLIGSDYGRDTRRRDAWFDRIAAGKHHLLHDLERGPTDRLTARTVSG